jgi:hypothetical protein
VTTTSPTVIFSSAPAELNNKIIKISDKNISILPLNKPYSFFLSIKILLFPRRVIVFGIQGLLTQVVASFRGSLLAGLPIRLRRTVALWLSFPSQLRGSSRFHGIPLEYLLKLLKAVVNIFTHAKELREV